MKHSDDESRNYLTALFLYPTHIALLSLLVIPHSVAVAAEAVRTQVEPFHWKYEIEGNLIKEEWDRNQDGKVDCISEPYPKDGREDSFRLLFDSNNDGAVGEPGDDTTYRYRDRNSGMIYEHDLDSDGTIDSVTTLGLPYNTRGLGRDETALELLRRYIGPEVVFSRKDARQSKEFNGEEYSDHMYFDRPGGKAINATYTYTNDTGYPYVIQIHGLGTSYVDIYDRDTNGIPEEFEYITAGYMIRGWIPRKEYDTNQDGFVDRITLLDDRGRVLSDDSGIDPADIPLLDRRALDSSTLPTDNTSRVEPTLSGNESNSIHPNNNKTDAPGELSLSPRLVILCALIILCVLIVTIYIAHSGWRKPK